MNRTSMIAAAAVLWAVAAAHAQSGPLAALEKARGAAAAASARATDTDAAAEGERSPDVGATRRDAAVGDAADAAAEPASATGTHDGGRAANTDTAEQTEATTRYDPSQHRDPFRPPTVANATADAGPRTPLEGYEVGQLKLVGVVWDTGTARAMVEDSSGLGYIVTAGTPIGSSGGFVRSIEPRRVLIEESVTNFYGEKEPREVVMELPQEDRSP
jgi:Tfp pilus assembly protein PilP